MEWKSGGESGGGVGPGGGGEEKKWVEGRISQVGSYGGGGLAIGRANGGQSSGLLPPQAACVNGAQVFGGESSRNPFEFGGRSAFGLGLSSPNGGMHVGGDGGLGFGPYGVGGLGFGSFGRGGFGFSSFGGSNSGEGTRIGSSGSSKHLVMDPSNGVLNGNLGLSSVNRGLVRCCCRGGKCMNSYQVAQEPLGETFGGGGVENDKTRNLGNGGEQLERSKGPESKKKILGGETAVVSESGEAIAGKELKRKRGRPMGSKTKKKIVDGETHARKKKVLGSETAVATESEVSESKKKILGSETSEVSEFVEASAGKELKRKPGRPMGSKTKKKIADGQTTVVVGSGGGQPGDINKILGRANEKIVDGRCADGTGSGGGQPRDINKILGRANEKVVDGRCADGTGSGGEEEGKVKNNLEGAKKKNAGSLEEGTGESGERKDGNNVKRRPGRPKGSKSKTKVSNGKTKLVAGLGEGEEGNHIDTRPMNEDAVVGVTTRTPRPVECQEGNEFKRKVGRPRRSEKEIFYGGDTVIVESVEGQEGNQLEKKSGRPKESKNTKKTPDGEFGQIDTGVDGSFPLKKRGQPIGSGRIKNHGKRYYIDVESFR